MTLLHSLSTLPLSTLHAAALNAVPARPAPTRPASAQLGPGKLTVLALLWLVTLWRLPSAVRAPRQRALWSAFVGVTVLVTLGVPAITDWIDATSGVHNVVVPIKHVIGLVACGGLLTFVADTARPDLAPRLRRPHLIGLLLAQVGLVISFCLIRQPTEVVDFYQAYPGSVPAAAYALIVAGYLGAAMGLGSWLFGTYARRAGGRWLRAGLWVLGLGTAAGFCYSVLRVCQIVLELFEQPMFMTAGLLYGIEWTAIALVLLGSSIPAVGGAWHWLRDWRTARRLGPLWAALTGAVPEVVLTARLGRSPRVRLHRLVIEIRDAALVLAPFADDALRERAAEHAAAAEERATLTEALWLRAAAAARLAGRTPGGPPAPGAAGSFEDLDFETETRRLLRLATAYRSPAADTFAQELQ